MRIHPTPERLNPEVARQIVKIALQSLDVTRLSRLMRHAEKKTEICCGSRASLYLDDGAASLSFLAEFDTVPPGWVGVLSVDGTSEFAAACWTYWRLQEHCERNCKHLYEDSCLAYDYAMMSLKPRDIRGIIMEVAGAHSPNA